MTEQRGKCYWHAVLISLLALTSVLVSCNDWAAPVNDPSLDIGYDSTIKVIFRVKLPKSVDGKNLAYALEILDEVTGLSLNPLRYELQNIDDVHYYVEITGKPGQILKYRYVKLAGIPMIETTSFGVPLRYRLYKIDYPSQVDDIVAGWEDQPYIGPKGDLRGQVITIDNQPVPALLVVAGGQKTSTDSEGRFFFTGLPEGLQRISLLSLDGSMPYFQQEAVIAENATTPARIILSRKKLINVSFEVTLPEGEYTGIPIRIVGDLYQLGNTFSDLHGGISIVASRAPVLTRLDENRYTYSIMLPEGTYFRYKYTLGDGFWNSERTFDDDFVLRELVVPGEDMQIKDNVETWQTRDLAPITFRVTAPQNTPQGEVISIQFNPYGWMEPIPMWFQGDSQWYFILYGPMDIVKTVQYRFCRNDVCDVDGISLSRAKDDDKEFSFSPSPITQTFQDDPITWNFLLDVSDLPTEPVEDLSFRDDFILGYEIDSKYQPEWLAFWDYGFLHMQETNAGLVIFTPTSPVFQPSLDRNELIEDSDLLWLDCLYAMSVSTRYPFSRGIFPILESTNGEFDQALLESQNTNFQEWFDRYRSYLIRYADMAEITGTEMLILGDPNASVTLASRILDANPGDPILSSLIQDRWEELINEIRSHYSGQLFWAIEYSGSFPPLPEWTDQLDGYYLLLDASILETNGGSSVDTNIEDLINAKEYDKIEEQGSPIILGVDIPSNNNECLQYKNTCGNSQEGILRLKSGLENQLNAYRLLLSLLSQEDQITGIVSRGYFPIAILIDVSSSIHGKPAELWLKNWFQREK